MKHVSKLGIVTLLLNSSLTIMVGSVIAPALPAIANQLHFQYSPGLLVTLPSLGVVIFSTLIGKMVNKLGPFKLVSLGLIPYAVLGYIGIYLTNNYLLMLDRLLLGAACVAIQVSVTTFIAQLFEGKERMKLIAWQGMAIELGGVVFLSVGGYIGELSWQYPFYIYLIALVFFLVTWQSLPKTVMEKPSATNNSHNSSNRQIYPIILGSLFAMAMFFVCFVNLPQYLPEQFHFSESSTGYFMSFISLIAVIVASQLPRVTEKFGSVNTTLSGFVFFSLGYLFFALAPTPWIMFLGALFIGLGFGFTIPLLNHMVVEVSSPQTRGRNLGWYSMMVFAGQFCATFTEFLPISIDIAFLYTAMLGVVATVFLFILFKKHE